MDERERLELELVLLENYRETIEARLDELEDCTCRVFVGRGDGRCGICGNLAGEDEQ